MSTSTQRVITRFAPSPTGHLHVGSARTVLFNYLFAKKYGGDMLLRIEDTDKERSKPEYEDSIRESLDWLKIDYTGGMRQSERTPIYRTHIERLLESGAAYISKETPQKEGDREEVIRFKNPNKVVAFDDEIRGRVEVDTTDLGDFVVAKSVEEPIYHLAVVIDDAEMEVTHVIRAEEHLSNTPRQILLQEALGFTRPTYAHIPLVLAPDKSKLSKRRHGESTMVTYYRDRGYLPEALLNYLALLGWNPGDDRELLSLEELEKEFDLSRVQKGGAVFDSEKLNWMNKEYMKELPQEEYIEHVKAFLPEEITSLPEYSEERLMRIIPTLKERLVRFGEVREMAENGDLEYYFEKPGYFAENLAWKDDKLEVTREHLAWITENLAPLATDEFTEESVKEVVWSYAEEKGRGNVLWPMRYALSGMDRSPNPFELAEILGKEETVERLSEAVGKIDEESY